MKKGFSGVVLFSVAVLASVAARAETESPFFQGDTPTRFGPPAELPPRVTSNTNDQPVIIIITFRYEAFESAEAAGVDMEALRQRVTAHRDERNGEYNVAELNDLVANLGNFLREQGFILARVIIPEQRLENATLTLQLVIGILGDVSPQNNNLYSDETLNILFEPLIDAPVQEAVLEQKLLRLSDFPGIDLRSSLTAGEQPGTTRLQLDVLGEQPFGILAAVDNYGSENTGTYRVTLAGQANNLANRADQLSAQLRFSLLPNNSISGQTQYRMPLDMMGLGGPVWLWDNTDASLNLSGSAFSVGGDLEILDIEGGTRQFGLRTERYLGRSQIKRSSVYQSLQFKRSNSDLNDDSLGDDRLTVLSLGGTWQASDGWLGGGVSQLDASVNQGIGSFLGSMDGSGDEDSSRVGSSGDRAGGTFTVWRLSGERTQAVGGQYLSLQSDLQLSSNLLTSLEQYSFGGSDTVRGYPAGDRSADSAWALSVEYYGLSAAPELTLPVSQLKLAAFWDFAMGSLNEALPNEEANPTAMSVGVYTEFRLARHYQTRLDLAVPIGAQMPSDGRRVSFGFRISRTF